MDGMYLVNNLDLVSQNYMAMLKRFFRASIRGLNRADSDDTEK